MGGLLSVPLWVLSQCVSVSACPRLPLPVNLSHLEVESFLARLSLISPLSLLVEAAAATLATTMTTITKPNPWKIALEPWRGFCQ